MCKGCTRVSCVLLACVFTRVLASCCFCRLFDCLHVFWLPALLATAVSSLFVPRPLPPYGTIGRGKSCAPMLGLWHMLCQTSSSTGMSAALCYGVLCYPLARKMCVRSCWRVSGCPCTVLPCLEHCPVSPLDVAPMLLVRRVMFPQH